MLQYFVFDENVPVECGPISHVNLLLPLVVGDAWSLDSLRLFEETSYVEFESEAVGMRWLPLIIADRVFLLAQLECGMELFERFEQ